MPANVSDGLKTTFAIVVAAAVAGISSAGAIVALPLGSDVELTEALFFAAAVAALSIPVLLTFGIAWHLFALDRGWRGCIRYAAAGAIAGITVGALTAAATVSLWRYALFAPAVGALSAIAFWLVRRPDRDAPNPPTSSA